MTELSLEQNIPVLLTPSLLTATVQNSMQSSDDKLMVSTSGDVDEAWTTIEPRNYIKIDTPMYFMQTSWATYVFPVIEV